MKPSERMQMLTEYLKMGAVTLANKTGLSRQRIRDIIVNDGKVVNPEIADAICAKFPQISRDWILSGIGEMIIKEHEESPEEPKCEDEREIIRNLIEVCQRQQNQIDQLIKAIQSLMETNKVVSVFNGMPNVELGDPEELEENK